MAVLARPAALPAAALLACVAGSRRRALAFAVAFALVLAPWVVRNGLLHGRALITTNSGVTLVGGNSSAALDAPHPGKWMAPDVVYAQAADPPDLGMWGWSALSEEASDRRFRSHAVDFVLERPADAARLVLWKLLRLFDPDPRSAKGDAAWKRVLGWASTAPVLLLALAGLCAQRRSLRRGSPWSILIVGTVLVACVFYGDARMRTAADPALLVFAGHGLVLLGSRRRSAGLSRQAARSQ
jgi:hypothetical protein